jgi:monoamine oxidase
MPDARSAPIAVTRRQFLTMVGATLGSAAVMNTMSAWGLMDASAQIDPPELEGDPGETSVIILGAGPGGLAAAYELLERGYDVHVLEAKDYLGGHVLTVRPGTRFQEFGGEEQVCEWPEGLWFEAGPSRVPFHHRAFLHYSDIFDIPLSEYNIINYNAFAYAEGIEGPLDGERVRVGAMMADMAGYTSELLARADDGQLDDMVSPDDQERLLQYLVSWGLISSDDLTYHGSNRAGYEVPPGVDSPGVTRDPYPFEDILPFASAVVRAQAGYLSAVPTRNWQETMVYPTNGMDTWINDGFGAALEGRYTLNAPVQEIRQDDDQVRIVY